MKSKLFTAKGNTAGFTKDGKQVMGSKRKDGSWQVWTDEFCRDRETFPTAADADKYALSLIDEKKTAELKWWK